MAAPTDQSSSGAARSIQGVWKSGRVFEWDIPECPGPLDEHVSWAAFDALGQLVVARLGVLLRYNLEGLHSKKPSAAIDLESLERPPRPDSQLPAEDLVEPKGLIEMVNGDLPDLDVRALIIPDSKSLWVCQLRDLAGDPLKAQLQEWSPEFDDVLLTPAYYLRQHDLVHVCEPPPSYGIESLRKACHAAFEAASMGSDSSVALKPIGLDAGWPPEDAMAATMEAASEYLEGDPGRRVLLVADQGSMD